MTRTTVIEEVSDGVAVLTMNRPARRNAFNDQQYDELRAALADAQADDGIRVVVITGAPGAFSAGQDINEMGSGRQFTPFVDQLATFDKPLLAAVNGVAVGIGVTMLLHCDIVYVAESARLRAPFVALGLVPEAGSSVAAADGDGPQRAAGVLFTAAWLDARQAVGAGWRAASSPTPAAPGGAGDGAEIAAQPVAALRATKRVAAGGARPTPCARRARARMSRSRAHGLARRTSPRSAPFRKSGHRISSACAARCWIEDDDANAVRKRAHTGH